MRVVELEDDPVGQFARSKSFGRMRFTKSLMDAATKKYCCCSRSSLPCGVESSG